MKYTILTAKNGEKVPAINNQPLHSMVDPVREAEKLLTTVPEDTGFLVFLGLGGGFAHLKAVYSGTEVTVIEFGKEGITELLSSKDYSPIKNLLIDPSDEEIFNYILANYKPALHGGIKVIPLRTRCGFDKEKFELAAAAIQKAVSAAASDYSVQAHFGKRWFCNTIRNLASLEKCNVDILPEQVKEAAVIAAGPSLNHQINEIKKLKARGVFIISADTALGALLSNGIEPDTVISIDCQHISYYHFLGHNISHIPLVLDIASPPLLSGISGKPVFFASGHPLALYISSVYKELPHLDTTGGNVTYTGVSLAKYLGAENITLFGADFAFVGSETYARGTYVYPYFEKRQNRITGLESLLSAFMYRSQFLEAAPGQNYRETAQLKFYREKMEAATGVKIIPGSGVPVQIINLTHIINLTQSFCARKRDAKVTQRKTQRAQKGMKGNESAIEFLKDYRDKISEFKDQNIITTLLPYIAYLRKRNPELTKNGLIEKTKLCCINEINKLLIANC